MRPWFTKPVLDIRSVPKVADNTDGSAAAAAAAAEAEAAAAAAAAAAAEEAAAAAAAAATAVFTAAELAHRLTMSDQSAAASDAAEDEKEKADFQWEKAHSKARHLRQCAPQKAGETNRHDSWAIIVSGRCVPENSNRSDDSGSEGSEGGGGGGGKKPKKKVVRPSFDNAAGHQCALDATCGAVVVVGHVMHCSPRHRHALLTLVR